jgi:hemoglobin
MTATPATTTQPAPDLEDGNLHALLEAFYATITRDPLLGPYFIDLDMREHMPRIVAFWSTILFHTGRYSDNAFRPHLAMPGLTAAHFTRWVAMLEQTINERFEGSTAERMKDYAQRIATSMQLRLGITAPSQPASASPTDASPQPPAAVTLDQRSSKAR